MDRQRRLDHVQLVVWPAFKLLHFYVAPELDKRCVGLVEEELGHEDVVHFDGFAAVEAGKCCWGVGSGGGGDRVVADGGGLGLRVRGLLGGRGGGGDGVELDAFVASFGVEDGRQRGVGYGLGVV